MKPVRLLLVAAVLALPAIAWSAPITFALDHGSLSLEVRVDGVAIATGVGTLDSGSVDFDPAALTIPTFALGASGSIYAPLLPLSYDTIDLTSITLAPGLGYSSSGSGTNPTTVTLGPVAVGFAGSIIDGALPPLPFAGVLLVPTYTADVTHSPGGLQLSIYGMKLASFSAAGHVIEIFSDIEFVGFAVPEPALVGLLAAAALAGLALRRG